MRTVQLYLRNLTSLPIDLRHVQDRFDLILQLTVTEDLPHSMHRHLQHMTDRHRIEVLFQTTDRATLTSFPYTTLCPQMEHGSGLVNPRNTRITQSR